mgnify:CR=1 FL=1
MFTFRNVRILFAAALLAAIFCLAGCSTAAQAVPQPAETSRSAEATPETAAPAPTATPEPTPAAIVPTSVTLDQEGGILNRGMTWTLRATVLPEDAADKTVRWTSSDESVATIDDAGVITALHPGQTTITAASEAGGVSTTYTLLVQEVATCSYCGGTGHTASACPSKAAVEQTQAASVPLPRLHPSNPKRLSLPSRLPLTPATRSTGQAAASTPRATPISPRAASSSAPMAPGTSRDP